MTTQHGFWHGRGITLAECDYDSMTAPLLRFAFFRRGIARVEVFLIS